VDGGELSLHTAGITGSIPSSALKLSGPERYRSLTGLAGIDEEEPEHPPRRALPKGIGLLTDGSNHLVHGFGNAVGCMSAKEFTERDPTKSARFLAEILGRPAPVRFGPFQVVALDNGVSLDFAAADGPIQPQHHAFLISETDFAAVFDSIREQGLQYWADPRRSRPGEINRNDGGRGVYFAVAAKRAVSCH
jgi:hypothetical protein